MYLLTLAIISSSVILAKAQVNLDEHFQQCHLDAPAFDSCVKDGINALRPYFKTGLPDYKILPFDPFFAPEVPQKRSGPFYNYKLILRNVSEAGWTASYITNFKSDKKKNQIQYSQFFPDKKLWGEYEIEGTFFGQKVSNKGSWNLALYDYTQTTTITKKPVLDHNGVEVDYPPLKVNVVIKTCKRLELHIGNLAGGRTIVENMLDWIINTAWQPGFVVLSPLINDLVSTAFTEIFNKNFQYFPIEKLFSG